MNSLLGLSVHEFLKRLASDAPTPGGGSAAALVGAMSAALGQMAAALTIGRPKFEAVEAEVTDLRKRLTRASGLMSALAEEDAAAYRELSAAFKIEKDAPQRKAQIEQAASIAASVPLETVAVGHQIRADLSRLLDLANPNLRSDVEAGLHLATAAMLAAAANVRVNLPWLPAESRELIERQLATLLAH